MRISLWKFGRRILNGNIEYTVILELMICWLRIEMNAIVVFKLKAMPCVFIVNHMC